MLHLFILQKARLEPFYLGIAVLSLLEISEAHLQAPSFIELVSLLAFLNLAISPLQNLPSVSPIENSEKHRIGVTLRRYIALHALKSSMYLPSQFAIYIKLIYIDMEPGIFNDACRSKLFFIIISIMSLATLSAFVSVFIIFLINAKCIFALAEIPSR